MIEIIFILIMPALLIFMCVNVYCLGRTDTELHVLEQMRKILEEMEITEEKIEYNKGIYHCMTEIQKHKQLKDTVNDVKKQYRELINNIVKKCQHIKNRLKGNKNS